eukprot:ctg_1166.g476
MAAARSRCRPPVVVRAHGQTRPTSAPGSPSAALPSVWPLATRCGADAGRRCARVHGVARGLRRVPPASQGVSTVECGSARVAATAAGRRHVSGRGRCVAGHRHGAEGGGRGGGGGGGGGMGEP